jgi:hypothetical protein
METVTNKLGGGVGIIGVLSTSSTNIHTVVPNYFFFSTGFKKTNSINSHKIKHSMGFPHINKPNSISV